MSKKKHDGNDGMLRAACQELYADLLRRAETDSDGTKVVDVSAGVWDQFKRALTPPHRTSRIEPEHLRALELGAEALRRTASRARTRGDTHTSLQWAEHAVVLRDLLAILTTNSEGTI